MSDLVEWLTKILDEDERLANEAATRDGVHDPHWSVRDWPYEGIGVWRGEDGGGFEDAQTRHIERHDPAAVQADVAAKRAIIARHAAVRVSGDTRCAVCIKPEWPCATLHDMATAYADRPGYDESRRTTAEVN